MCVWMCPFCGVCLCVHVSVCIDNKPRCDEVGKILWPTLLQPNPFLAMLVDPNGPTEGGSCKGDVLPGTDIGFIDKQWPESLAYFSWVHLERRYAAHRGRADKLTKHVSDFATEQARDVWITIHTFFLSLQLNMSFFFYQTFTKLILNMFFFFIFTCCHPHTQKKNIFQL